MIPEPAEATGSKLPLGAATGLAQEGTMAEIARYLSKLGDKKSRRSCRGRPRDDTTEVQSH